MTTSIGFSALPAAAADAGEAGIGGHGHFGYRPLDTTGIGLTETQAHVAAASSEVR